MSRSAETMAASLYAFLVESRFRWLGLLLAVPALTGSVHVLGALGPAQPLPIAVELSVYSNALLLAAAAAYVLHVRVQSVLLGCWATGLTIAATVELALSAAAACLGQDGVPDSAAWPGGAALFTLLALASYLLIESVYRDRRAGAFVLPVIACVAFLHAWLVAAATQLSADAFLSLQWSLSAAVFATLGYGLLAAGGLLAARTLLAASARQANSRAAADAAVHARESFSRMVRANLAGLLVLGAAAAGWEAWAQTLPRASLFLSPLEPWVLGVLVAYAGHLLLLLLLRPPARQTAGWAAALFAASLVLLMGTMATSWPPPV